MRVSSSTVCEVAPFSVDPFCLELLGTLARAGFSSPLLCGGALRDTYLGHPDLIKDYDIRVGMIDVLPAKKQWRLGPALQVSSHKMHERPDDFANLVIKRGLQRISSVTDIGIHRLNATWAPTLLDFTYKGRAVSLFEDIEAALPIEERVHGDAPLNAVVMDSNGRFFADRLFAAHAAQMIFAPYPSYDTYDPSIEDPEKYGKKRYGKLRKKYPALKYKPVRASGKRGIRLPHPLLKTAP